MIDKETVDKLKRYAHIQRGDKNITSTLDLWEIRGDIKESHANLCIAYEPLTWVIKDLLVGQHVSFAEYEDRKGERSIDGQLYFAWKLFVPEIRFLTIASSDVLLDEYFMVCAPDDGVTVDLGNYSTILHHVGLCY